MPGVTPTKGGLGPNAQGVQKLNFRYGRSISGSNPSFDISAGSDYQFQITVNGDGPHLVTIPSHITCNSPQLISDAIEHAIHGISATDPTLNLAFRQFTAYYDDGKYNLVSGLSGATSAVVVTNAGSNNIADDLKLGIANTGVENTYYPKDSTYAALVDIATTPVPVTIEGATVEVNVDVDATSLYPSDPTIANVPVILASTEVSYTLPANTREFSVKVRGGTSQLKLSFTVGQSGTNYITVQMGDRFVQKDVVVGALGLTLYFQTVNAAQTVEILYWV